MEPHHRHRQHDPWPLVIHHGADACPWTLTVTLSFLRVRCLPFPEPPRLTVGLKAGEVRALPTRPSSSGGGPRLLRRDHDDARLLLFRWRLSPLLILGPGPGLYPGTFRLNTAGGFRIQRLARTILTSLTTLLVVGALFLFGGGAINDFALVMLIGIVVGTYSSVFVASAIIASWHKRSRAHERA